MITNTVPRELPATTPPLIKELRKQFDERLTGLYNEVSAPMPVGQGESSEEVRHAFFEHDQLHVTAVYNTAQQRFTQLIARDVAHVADERPAFTISIFL